MYEIDEDVGGEEFGHRHVQTVTSEITESVAPIQQEQISRFLGIGMQPEHLDFSKALVEGWNYEDSIIRVRCLFHSWRLVSEDLLWELWWDKYNLTAGFTRTAGRAKDGERTWNTFLTECFKDNGGPSKRTVDLWIDAFIAAGYTKPERLHGHKAPKQPEQTQTHVVNDAPVVAPVRTVEDTPNQTECVEQEVAEPVNTSDVLVVVEPEPVEVQTEETTPTPQVTKSVSPHVEPLVDIIDVERLGDKVWFTIYVPHTDAKYPQVIPA